MRAVSWYPTVSDLLSRCPSLWTAVSREISKEDHIVGQLTMVKQAAFQMREYAGRERAVHAGNISAKPRCRPSSSVTSPTCAGMCSRTGRRYAT